MSKISLYMDEDSTARSLALTLKSREIEVISALEQLAENLELL